MEIKSTDEEWNSKIDRIISVELDSQDYKRFIGDLARKLKETSDRYHTFRDRANKLNEEKGKRRHEIDELKSAHQSEKVHLMGEIASLKKKVEQSSTIKNDYVDNKNTNVHSLCRPGSFGAKRKVQVPTVSVETVSNGMGGVRRAKLEFPKDSSIPSKPESKSIPSLKTSTAKIQPKSKLLTPMDQWLKRK